MKNALAALALLLLAGTADAGGNGKQDRKNRSFYMGVTGMPHDMTPEAVESLMLFILDHTDIVSIKIEEGVPWSEALEKRPYGSEFENSLEGKKKFPQDKKVFLCVTPLNGGKDGLAHYRGKGENEPLPDSWAKREFDEPEVARAYLNYCRDMIRRFRPDFFAYGVEVNNLVKHPQKWKKFVPFARDIYAALKKENPSLPILFTVNIETATEAEQVTTQKKALTQVLPFTDIVAVTGHPYIHQPNPAKIPKDYFSQITSLAPGKPFAIAETIFPAEDGKFLGQDRIGKAPWQADYIKFCLDEAARLNAKFVVWSVSRDLDQLFDKIPGVQELLGIWKDTGLLDGEGKPRKSFETWAQWLKLPKK